MLEIVSSVIRATSDTTQNVKGVATHIKSYLKCAPRDLRIDTYPVLCRPTEMPKETTVEG